jgi:membrane-associated protease RseP (regulator of RpoE activity)
VKKNLCWLIALTLLAAAPAALAGDEGKGDEKVEKRVMVISAPDGTTGKVEVVHANPRVEVHVLKQEEGEGRHFVWHDASGDVHELDEQMGDFVFAPGAERGFLGVQLTDLTPELRTHFGAREDAGVLIAKLVEDGPAAKAGLRVGDVLTHIDGEAVTSSFDATARIGAREEGSVVALEVVRDGRVNDLSATLERRERAQLHVGPLLRRLGEEGSTFTYELDPEALNEHVEGMERYFASPEWKTQVMEIEGIDEDIRVRLEKIEVEIERLQDQLDVDVDVEVEMEDEKGDDG